MKFRVCPPPAGFHRLNKEFVHHRLFLPSQRLILAPISSRQLTTAPASFRGRDSSSSKGVFFLPGATVATIVMLGLLHGRRMYYEKKAEEVRGKGIELEFSPDIKAVFLRFLPLRPISRFWGFLTNMEIPIWLRPYMYKAWARAFHSNLDEAALPLDKYASLQEFFVRNLKEGLRPVDPDPYCLVSPVDGMVLRCGQLRQPGAMIEQVKGFSYSASCLLGSNSFFPMVAKDDRLEMAEKQKVEETHPKKRSWWRVSLASPKFHGPTSECSLKGLFYCVLYLKPGDYHRVHSPVDWSVFLRRHFSGKLCPLNERATRTIRNLYVENERVVLEGQWKEGFMAVAAVGATNVGSIQLSIEPELRTNRPRKGLARSDPPDECVYEPVGIGVKIKKGEEIAAFNMGSTVVLVFQAPISTSRGSNGAASDFKFSIKNGDKVRVGEAIGRWLGP